MKPKIGLVGYFGWGNFGDELFVKAHQEFLSDKFELEVVHDLTEAPYFSDEKLKNLEKYDGFLIGGGDLINPSAVSELYWRMEYLKKPTFIYGIGVPMIGRKSSKAINHYKQFFSHQNIKAIVLRDIESLNYFKEVIPSTVEPVTFPDAVCAMRLPKAVKSQDKIIGISLRDHRSVVGEYENVRKAADHAKKLGYKVRIIIMANGLLGEGDNKVSLKFKLPDEELVYSQNLDDICRAIGECHQLISMKFHGMIVATLYGVPSLQLAATQKNKNFLRYIQRQDMQTNYQDENIYDHIPKYPVSIHSILRRKLNRDAKSGYSYLLEKMNEVFYK